MKIYIKWFYWYRNFWDEIIFFWLINYLQKKYNPENFTVEVWSTSWMQQRINQNSQFLDSGILDKIDFVENMEISRRLKQFQSFLWIDKYKKYFKVFWWWEVFDENRKFPHDGRNLPILHHYCIKKWNFILVWWIWTDHCKRTKLLFKKILHKANEIVCRESISVERSKKYGAKNVVLFQDFSKNVLLSENSIKWKKESDRYVLINISPKYFTPDNINKIKKFSDKFENKYKKIFFPADINLDKKYYSEVRKLIPDLEIYDWTRHSLSDTINLFKSCEWWIWSRLHFLYPLKIFNKNFENIANSDKIQKMINNS